MGKKKTTSLVTGGAHIQRMDKITTGTVEKKGAPIPSMQPVQQPPSSGQGSGGQGSNGNQSSGNTSGGNKKN